MLFSLLRHLDFCFPNLRHFTHEDIVRLPVWTVFQHIINVWIKPPSRHSHRRANNKWPCLPLLYLNVFYSIISKGNRRKWWTAGNGRCPSHILYLELVEIATMILCQFHRIDVISKFYLGCEPLEGRALFILASPVGVGRGEFLNHSMEGKFFVQGRHPLCCRMCSSIPTLNSLDASSTPSPSCAN